MSDPSDSPRGMSRRGFFKGAGATAIGAAILESPLARAAEQATTDAATKTLGPGAVPIDLVVNGQPVRVAIEPRTTLVELLRDELMLIGTKIGCDRGACSACTVWLDGTPVSSCMTLAMDCRGKAVTTIEGLADGETLHPVQQAFVDHDAMQCGFCTPGMVMSCAALLNRKPDANLDDVKHAISGHICRCGAYPNIFNATLSVAGKQNATTQKAGA